MYVQTHDTQDRSTHDIREPRQPPTLRPLPHQAGTDRRGTESRGLMTQTVPNKRLQGDAFQRQLVPRSRFQARLRRSVRGAADKAANLGGESPLPSIARFGRLAYPT